MRKIALLLISALLTGCISAGKASTPAERYTLVYAPPQFENMSPLVETIKVELFSSDPQFGSPVMVYSTGTYNRGIYTYARWNESPADLVTERLLKDLRSSGLFRAVFSPFDDNDARYLIGGRIEDFLEVDEGNVSRAVLAVNVTLFDWGEERVRPTVAFQRDYRSEGSVTEKTGEGLARGMSGAMRRFSEELTKDIYDYLTRNHTAQTLPPFARPGSRPAEKRDQGVTP